MIDLVSSSACGSLNPAWMSEAKKEYAPFPNRERSSGRNGSPGILGLTENILRPGSVGTVPHLPVFDFREIPVRMECFPSHARACSLMQSPAILAWSLVRVSSLEDAPYLGEVSHYPSDSRDARRPGISMHDYPIR